MEIRFLFFVVLQSSILPRLPSLPNLSRLPNETFLFVSSGLNLFGFYLTGMECIWGHYSIGVKLRHLSPGSKNYLTEAKIFNRNIRDLSTSDEQPASGKSKVNVNISPSFRSSQMLTPSTNDIDALIKL